MIDPHEHSRTLTNSPRKENEILNRKSEIQTLLENPISNGAGKIPNKIQKSKTIF